MKKSHLNKTLLLIKATTLCLLFSVASTAFANAFFTAYVEVKAPDKSQFKQASSKALLQILEKSTGRSTNELLSHNTIKQAVQNASRSVQQFSYQQDTVQGVRNYFLSASFSKAKVSQLLQDANFKMLLDHRPSIAVVVVLQVEGRLSILRPGNEILDADYNDLIRSTTIHGINAKEIDQASLSTLSATKLWYFNESYINGLATKFKVDNILVVRLAKVSNGRWVGGSTLVSQSETRQPFKAIELNDEAFAHVLNPLLAKLNQYWLSLYAVRLSHSQNEVVLQVKGINNFAAFKQLTQDLETMSVVDHVYTLQAESEFVTLSVSLKSDFSTFKQHLNSLKSLQENDVMLTGEPAEASQVLHYLWAR